LSKISFVVDAKSLYYYQAELLLFSLEHFAKYPKEDILVHCVEGISPQFILYLKENHYAFKLIPRFLDGKYCNKILQLDSFAAQPKDSGVFFVDTDIFFVEPLPNFNSDAFHGRIVGGSNPPLSVLESIFQKAGVPPPSIVNTSWAATNECTYSTNFNGGFFYVPAKHIKILSQQWKKHAIWLFENQSVFETEQQKNHIDQVAMALALSETNIPIEVIPANFNYPVHISHPQRLFDEKNPLTTLHYHNALSIFGTLQNKDDSADHVKLAIQKSNDAISTKAEFIFYEEYRKSLITPIKNSHKSEKLSAAITNLKIKYSRSFDLILHGGTSKTGTTSLQFFLNNNPSLLKNSGYLYPSNIISEFDPKHQWLMFSLLNSDENLLIENLNIVFSQLEKEHDKVILSTEGIFHHWQDFDPEAKSFLSILASQFSTIFWVWFRKPIAYLDSLYRQGLKNHKNKIGHGISGEDLSFEEVLKNEWFLKHLDYIGFVYEIETILGKDRLKLFTYNEDVIPTLCKELGIKGGSPLRNKENKSLSHLGCEILRIINRSSLNHKEKEECVKLVQKLDEVISPYSPSVPHNEAVHKYIKDLSSIGLHLLERDYFINLKQGANLIIK
jgi:hypothetical protein